MVLMLLFIFYCVVVVGVVVWCWLAGLVGVKLYIQDLTLLFIHFGDFRQNFGRQCHIPLVLDRLPTWSPGLHLRILNSFVCNRLYQKRTTDEASGIFSQLISIFLIQVNFHRFLIFLSRFLPMIIRILELRLKRNDKLLLIRPTVDWTLFTRTHPPLLTSLLLNSRSDRKITLVPCVSLFSMAFP